jgi:hypothetical protein
MFTLITVLTVIAAISLLVSIASLVSVRKMESDVSLTRSDVIAIRRQSIPPNLGGRSIPTLNELEAARNRVDASGTAHPGGS